MHRCNITYYFRRIDFAVPRKHYYYYYHTVSSAGEPNRHSVNATTTVSTDVQFSFRGVVRLGAAVAQTVMNSRDGIIIIIFYLLWFNTRY